MGVHDKPVEFHIERLWSYNITLTMRLMDTVTTPMLLKIVQLGRLDAKERALKVVLINASAGGGA